MMNPKQYLTPYLRQPQKEMCNSNLKVARVHNPITFTRWARFKSTAS